MVGRLDKEVRMGAKKAADGFRGSVNCLHKLSWQLSSLSALVKNSGAIFPATERSLSTRSSGSCPCQPRNTNSTRSAGARPPCSARQFMPHNQQFIGVLNPKGLNAHEGRGDYDRVVPVRS